MSGERAAGSPADQRCSHSSSRRLRCLPTPTRPCRLFALAATRAFLGTPSHRAGVERQRVDCEALCTARGWEIVQYFEDNDRSGYSGKKRRAYEQMLATVEGGGLNAVVTLPNDRLHRSPRELEVFIDLVGASRCPGGGGRGRRLRPHDLRWSLHCTDRRSGRPQGIRGPQPASPPQALGAGRAGAAGRSVGLGGEHRS